MLTMVGDFETTTDPTDTRVWASCLVNVDDFVIEQLSNNIEGFINFISDKNSTVYFHNLKFDGEFIIHWLLSNGYECNNTKDPKTFSTLITDMGQFYSITIYFKRLNKRYHKCTIYDSLKKLPFPVSRIAKAFKLEESKLEIDYKAHRPIGHILTEEEREYIIADCMIVAKALNTQFKQGLTKMTIGADALGSFKGIISKKRFDLWFPILPLDVDTDIRQSYKGGFTYLNPKYKNQRLEGIVFDVNSLYPSVMYFDNLPYGYPITYDGEYKLDELYPLYIQRVRCEFKVKKNFIPTIQLKNNHSFIQTEYLASSKGEMVEMTLTNVDLDLFLKHYDVWNMEYISGYKFKQCQGVFKEYIDYWMEIKANNEGAMRELAKLMLNNLYGKFATNPKGAKKTPYLDDDEIVRYTTEAPEYRNPVYTPMGCFITAYSRLKTIKTAQENFDRFIYADTDSLHLVGQVFPDIEVHKSKLGAWKFEGSFTDSKFLRAKTYMETMEGITHVTCAGMPDNVKQSVTYDNFTSGSSYSGKLRPKRVKGGIVLEDSNFTLTKG